MKRAPKGQPDAGEVWQAVINDLEEGFVVFDRDGRLLTGNPAAARLLGVGLEALPTRTLTDGRWGIVREDGLPCPAGDYPAARSLRSGRTETALLGVDAQGGLRRWLQVKAQPLKRGEEVERVVVTFSDVTEPRAAEARLGREAHFRRTLLAVVTESLAQNLDERFYQRLLEGAVAAIPNVEAASLLLLEAGRYEFVAAVGYELAALRGVYLLPEELYRGDDPLSPLVVYGYDNREVAEERRRVIDGAGRAAEIKVCLSLPVLLYGEPVAYLSLDNFASRDAFGHEALTMGRIFAQQTAALWQRFRLEAEMRRLAYYDPLTGLPNRTLLYDRLRQALARRAAGPLAVLFLDLDDFKEVNDTLGHDAGDALLREVAARLSAVVREGDTLARWGGDEFVLLTELAHPADAGAVAEKLLGALERPFRVCGRERRVRSSLGVSLLGAAHAAVEEALKHADIALYRAKAAGKGGYRVFTDLWPPSAR